MNRKKNLNVRSALRAVCVSFAVIALFIGIVLVYYSMLRNKERELIIKNGQTSAKQTATEFDEYLATSFDAMKITAYTLDGMLREEKSSDEMLDYLVGQTNAIINTIFENTTGIYGYIDGVYIDGTYWEPPADYDPKSRPWYIKAIESDGEIAIVEPYLDMQTGDIMMSLAKELEDGESVVAFDMTLNRVQKITEEAVSSELSDIEFILDRNDMVIAHSDKNEFGKDYGTEKGTLGAEIAGKLSSDKEGFFEFDYEGSHYIVYYETIRNDWRCVSVKDASSAFRSLDKMLMGTIGVIVLIVVILAILFSNNLTRRLANERLSKQLSSTADIYISMHDIDLLNDTFVEVINKSQELAGVSGDVQKNAQELIRSEHTIHSDPESRDEILDFVDFSSLDERMKDGNTITCEFKSAKGQWRRGRFIVSGRLQDGSISNVMYLVEDIDAEKEERERLINASERALAASEAKSSFLSNMSHEIRTPINAVLGMNEMILRESSDTNILEYAESIRTAGSTLMGIVNDILDFSKIEAGKMEIIPVDYDLSSVINDLVNMIRSRAEAKGLKLEFEISGEIPKLLHGDEVRIKQIVMNILTNAVKYTEKGSVTLCVGYEKTEDDPDSILLNIAVKDTGIGIKKEDMKKLFSEFDRIEEERNRHIEGTGLGMSITKRLLEMMGSELKVESTYGSGSRFSFSLKQKVTGWDPLGDFEDSFKASVKKREKYHESFHAPEAEVLVIDDTQMNLMVFTHLLKKTGIRIDTATSGDEGLSLTLEKKYDIIFLDHMMPDKDGIQTFHELRERENDPNHDTPVICLTANAISGAREMYLAEGFDDYLTKPFESEELEEMLIKYLPDEKILD